MEAKTKTTQNFRSVDQVRGLTLVELLTVVSLLAILMAMLLPSLKLARESVRSIQCVNNLRQVGLALTNYMSEYDSTTPKGYDSTAPAGYNFWTQVLCNKGYLPVPISGRPHVLVCPSQNPKVWSWWQNTYGYRTYSNLSYTGYRMDGTVITTAGSPIMDFGPPQTHILVGDTVDPSNGTQCYILSSLGWTAPTHARHNGRANFLFGDNHVTSLSSQDLMNNYGASIPGYSFFQSGPNPVVITGSGQ